MPEHIDPFRELENFGTGGIVTTPLDPSEVRRLGNKRRVQRRARISAAVAAVVVAAVVPVAVVAGSHDGKKAPTPTQRPTATATPPSTITYPGNGIDINDPADVDKLKGTSPEFKTFVAAQVRRAIEAGKQCPDAAHGVTVQKYSSAGYAYGGYNDCGGYQALWAAQDGTWSEVYGSQDAWDCDILRYYDIPVAFVGNTCVDESGGFGPETVSDVALGMTKTQVEAVGGKITPSPGGEACVGVLLPYQEQLEGQSDGTFSATRGVVSLRARSGMKTPERVGWGTRLATMRAAYPAAHKDADGNWVVPLNSTTEYVFEASSSMVTGMELSRPDRDCLK